MKLIVISSPISVNNEQQIINSLFEEGLEIFHVYKPGFSDKEIKDFTSQISTKYQAKVFLHSDFLKFHSLDELKNHKGKYEYAFLSPIFNSISKQGYKSNFDLNEVKEKIKEENIIALGGIDEDKIEACRELGFAGVAVLGSVWKNSDPVGKFKSLKALCQKKDLVF